MSQNRNGAVRQLFGTDGIRAVAGEPPLDAPTVFAFGRALGRWARGHALEGQEPQVLIGMDTRESGPWLAETVAAALVAEGVTPRFAGLLTTPGVAWLTRTGPFVAGVMISASHNPYHDNGLKAFDHSGFKLPDSTELELEQQIFEFLSAGVTPDRLALAADPGLDEAYLDSLIASFPHRLDGRRIVLDCAHGAASVLAPELFRRLGAAVIARGCSPDGRNINDGCGALHTAALQEQVRAEQADFGFAFDGDADRCIGVSAAGRVIDGDAMLLVIGRHLQAAGRLPGAIVATVMSNLGFENALRRHGIDLLRTSVGDKYVLEEMVRRELPIGGEQSGHVIFRDFATTGDGMLTALRLLDAVLSLGRPLDELVADFVVYPQKLVNVKAKAKRPLSDLIHLSAAIAEAESAMTGQGRVLVRWSGTEPLLRIMVEAATTDAVEGWTARLAEVARNELN